MFFVPGNLFFKKVVLAPAVAGILVLGGCRSSFYARPPEASGESVEEGGDFSVLAARRYHQQGNYERALPILQKLTARFPENVTFWIEQAWASAKTGRRRLAIFSLNHAGKAGPGPREKHSIAMVYQDIGKYPRTLAILNELIAREPANSQYKKDKGICEFLQGDFKKSAASLREAIDLSPEDFYAYRSLAAVYISRRCYRQASAVYEEAFRRAGSGGENLPSETRTERESLVGLAQGMKSRECPF